MARVIKISSKQGFSCQADGCILYDHKGLFLQYDKAVNFNLPPGTYTVQKGRIGALPAPVVYPLPKLPLREKDMDLSGMKITEHKTTSVTEKACIDVANGDYYINPKWEKTLTTPQLVFCQIHEVGHFFYYTQEYCDMLAESEMLDMGFNPVQIAMASHTTLCGKCTNPGTMEKILNIDIPYESATRRLATEERMHDASMMTSMIQNLENANRAVMQNTDNDE